MPEYLAPGVYANETNLGPRPIEGVSTSMAAFLGETERGPLKPRLVTSLNEYREHFGSSFNPDKFMPDAVAGFFENGGKRAYVARVVSAAATRATRSVAGLTFEASGPGEWGNRVFVKVTDSLTSPGVAFRLHVAYWPEPLSGTPTDPFDVPEPGVQPAPIMEEFDGLGWADPEADNYYSNMLDRASALIKVSHVGPGLTAQPLAAFGALAGGFDGGTPTASDFSGESNEPAGRTGLAALELQDYRDVSLIAAPAASDDVVEAVIQHCEQNRYRFAVIDSPRGQGEVQSIDPRTKWDTKDAAYYCPWIQVTDAAGEQRMVPPSGHALGIYARTDTERGVFKAPANEIVRGAVGLEFTWNKEQQEILNPIGVNVIRQFEGRGIRVWGARTLTTDPEWKYVSSRRLLNFLEQSMDEGTQWVAFEPNNEALWQSVTRIVRDFLRQQWRLGALQGRKEEEAFYVKCDRTTMTEHDISHGRIICLIGVAPLKPAEFMVFRISQLTATNYS